MIQPFPVCHWSGKKRGAGKFVRNAGVNSGLLAIPDGRAGTCSWWWKWTGDGSLKQVFYAGDGDISNSLVISIETSGLLQIRGIDDDNDVRLLLRSTNVLTADSLWHHGLLSWDLAVAGTARMYIDDVDRLNEITYSSAQQLDYGSGFGGRYNLAHNGFTGCITEFYFDNNFYFDFDIEAERLKFRKADGTPEDLGVDGETPNGSQPLFYHYGNGSVGSVPRFRDVHGRIGLANDGFQPTDCADTPY